MNHFVIQLRPRIWRDVPDSEFPEVLRRARLYHEASQNHPRPDDRLKEVWCRMYIPGNSEGSGE